MAKFGDLINSNIPTLIDFYADWNENNSSLNDILKNVATTLGDNAKVIKIDIEKNKELAKALRIKGNPTFIIYKSGEMKWRQSGEQDADTLIQLIEQYL